MEIPIEYENYQLLGVEQPIILLLLIPIVLFLILYILRKGLNKGRIIFFTIRLLIFTLLITALASPYLIHLIDEYSKAASIIILEDKSESMRIYGKQNISIELLNKLDQKMREETGLQDMVKHQTFSEGNKTELGNALYQYIRKENKDNLIILVSDGNNNQGMDALDVARILGIENITIYPITPESMEKDIYISEFIGERKIPINADYLLRANVRKNGVEAVNYDLIFRVNNEMVKKVSVTQTEEEKNFDLKVNFPTSGVQKIEAVIKTSRGDFFEGNNKFNKIVEVADRPKVLMLSADESSPLLSVLRKNYDVIVTGDADEILKYSGDYDVIIIDDMPYRSLIPVVDKLYSYVIDGNGLVVVGGENSYAKGDYNNSYFETLLPVVSSEEPEQKRQPIAVVFCIDVSASLGSKGVGGYETYLDEGKAIAINLLRQLTPDDSISILAFNVPVWAWPKGGLVKIGTNRVLIEDYLSRLQVTEGGTSFHPVLTKADDILSSYESGKYVIFISDGYPTGDERDDTGKKHILDKIQRMADKGIQLYTVSIGDRAQAKAGMRLMQDMASEGNGLYFWMEDEDRLNIVFKEEEKKERDFYHIGVYDKYHFITRNIPDFVTSLDDYNGVTAKSISQTLLVTQDKDPILTVWRFGLGRVAALTTDNGRDWSLNIYTAEDGRLISSITNWAIGNLEKSKKVQITTEDTFIGQDASIIIKSDDRPILTISNGNGDKNMVLKQIDLNEYYSSISLDENGFYMLRAQADGEFDVDGIAVNYPAEFSSLGLNDDVLSRIAELTDGRLYTASEIDSLMEDAIEYAKQASKKEIREKTDIGLFLLIAALTIFFIDAIIRRINDILKRGRKQKKVKPAKALKKKTSLKGRGKPGRRKSIFSFRKLK